LLPPQNLYVDSSGSLHSGSLTVNALVANNLQIAGTSYGLDASGNLSAANLAKVATTGNYNDLIGLPTIPTIASTTDILVGDGAGNANYSGFSFPLSATNTSTISGLNSAATDPNLSSDGSGHETVVSLLIGSTGNGFDSSGNCTVDTLVVGTTSAGFDVSGNCTAASFTGSGSSITGISASQVSGLNTVATDSSLSSDGSGHETVVALSIGSTGNGFDASGNCTATSLTLSGGFGIDSFANGTLNTLVLGATGAGFDSSGNCTANSFTVHLTTYGFNSSGDISAANLNSATTDSNISSDGSGNLTAVSFIGSGASLTGVVTDASVDTYTPGNSSNWSGSPTTIQAALDRLAAAVAGLLGSPIP
jgi:hypothetical protein